jgi:hypothetical protein
MSHVIEAPVQDEIANSLLGEPEETTETATQDTGTEEQVVTEPEPEGEEQIQEEAADDWLPTDQEKVFPDEVLVRHAQPLNFDSNPILTGLYSRADFEHGTGAVQQKKRERLVFLIRAVSFRAEA